MLSLLLTSSLLFLLSTALADQTYTYQSQDAHFTYTPSDMWILYPGPGATGGDAEFCVGDTTNTRAGAMIYFQFPVAATTFEYWGWQRSDGGLAQICFDCGQTNLLPSTSPTLSYLNASTNGSESPRLLYSVNNLSYEAHTVSIVNAFDARATIGGSTSGGYGQLTMDRVVLTAPDSPPASASSVSSTSSTSSSTTSSTTSSSATTSSTFSSSATTSSTTSSSAATSSTTSSSATTSSSPDSAASSLLSGLQSSTPTPALTTSTQSASQTSSSTTTSSSSSSSSSSSTSTPTALPATNSSTTQTKNTGAIVGGVLAAALAILLLLLAAFCYRRRRARANSHIGILGGGSGPNTPTPFAYEDYTPGPEPKPVASPFLLPALGRTQQGAWEYRDDATAQQQERGYERSGSVDSRTRLLVDAGAAGTSAGAGARTRSTSSESNSNSNSLNSARPPAPLVPRRSTRKLPPRPSASSASDPPIALSPLPPSSTSPQSGSIYPPTVRERDAGWLAGEEEDGHGLGETLPPDYEEATERRRRMAVLREHE